MGFRDFLRSFYEMPATEWDAGASILAGEPVGVIAKIAEVSPQTAAKLVADKLEQINKEAGGGFSRMEQALIDKYK